MDEMMTQPTMTPMTPTTVKPSRPFYKRALFWIIVVALIIVAEGVWWYVQHKKAVVLTPQQTLDQLQSTSQPVITTPQQRAADLKAAEKSSVPVVVSNQKQLDILNQLSQ